MNLFTFTRDFAALLFVNAAHITAINLWISAVFGKVQHVDNPAMYGLIFMAACILTIVEIIILHEYFIASHATQTPWERPRTLLD